MTSATLLYITLVSFAQTQTMATPLIKLRQDASCKAGAPTALFLWPTEAERMYPLVGLWTWFDKLWCVRILLEARSQLMANVDCTLPRHRLHDQSPNLPVYTAGG